MSSTRRQFLHATAGSAIALFFMAFARSSRADDLESALAEVRVARAGLKTLKGPFTQERTIGLLATKVKSTGTLTMVRPDRLRWERGSPEPLFSCPSPEKHERHRSAALPARTLRSETTAHHPLT